MAMELDVDVGFRVVRGPAWSWGDQDGGEGHVGTVVEVGEGGRSVVVQWDCGNRYGYRCGEEGKCDLRVLDSAPAGSIHSEMCNWCQKKPLHGMIWKCARCYDYVLCTHCYMNGMHCLEHDFVRISRQDSPVTQVTARARLQRRYYTARVTANGIFEGAVVVRGRDWKWGDQDGGAGSPGRVLQVAGWGKETARSVVQVEWKATHCKNMYRVGHKGKVDLQCMVAGSGGYYYPDHLPLLGASHIPPEHQELAAGDTVRVELDPDLFKIAQDGHGGWNDIMAEFIGRDAVVTTIQDSGDMVVRYSSGKVFLLNGQTLTKVNVPVFRYGDVVRVLDDMVQVHSLQTGHGEWNDDMALSLGQVGRVIKIQGNGDIRVAVNGRRWIYNPLCLSLAPGETPMEEVTDFIDVGGRMRLQLLSLAQADCADVVVAAAEVGDVSAIIAFLQKYPSEVNTKYEGKGAIHIAVVGGFVPVLRTLLQFHPDLEMEDDIGEKALHLCSYVTVLPMAVGSSTGTILDNGKTKEFRTLLPGGVSAKLVLGFVRTYRDCAMVEAWLCFDDSYSQLRTLLTELNNGAMAKILLDAGADVNSKDLDGDTPLALAAAFGHYNVLELIVAHPNVQINEQDSDGRTPLHRAVSSHWRKSVEILMKHGADPTMFNFELLTPIHAAAAFGFVSGLEEIVRYCPEHINLKRDNGSTPLHVAAANDHCDVVSLLISHPSCNIDAGNAIKLTPLHIAVHEGYITIVERLVGFGANLNATDESGNTPLHLTLAKHTMQQPSNGTPQIKKLWRRGGEELAFITHTHYEPACISLQNMIQKELERMGRLSVPPNVIVALFLVQQGADPHIKGALGISPIQIRSPDVATLLLTFARDKGLFSGSLRHYIRPFGDASVTKSKMDVSPQLPSPGAVHSPPPGPDTKLPQFGKDFNKDTSSGTTTLQDQFHKDLNPYTGKPLTKTLDESARRVPELVPCFLCQKGADTKFLPCGHINMCSDCAVRTKKCPDCRAKVERFVATCVLCRKEQASHKRGPCGHNYCSSCGAQLSNCVACRILSTAEGEAP